MLILSRKINEEVLIGSTIRLIVLKVNGQRVKLGLAAPRGVAIYRKEIRDGEPQAAGAPSGSDRQHRSQIEDVEDVTESGALTAPLVTTSVSHKEL